VAPNTKLVRDAMRAAERSLGNASWGSRQWQEAMRQSSAFRAAYAAARRGAPLEREVVRRAQVAVSRSRSAGCVRTPRRYG
jgi:hypothetical protein